MALKFTTIFKGLVLRGVSSDPADNISGSMWLNSVTNKLKTYVSGAIRELVTNDQSQTLTNKTIDADDNTISDLEVDNLKTGVLNVDLTVPTPTDSEIPSALAVKTYSDLVQSGLSNHISDAVDAHDASAISADTTGYNYSIANEVQAVLDDFDAAILSETSAVQTNLTNHISNLSTHGNLQGTIPLLASQVNTNLLDLSAYSAARVMFYVAVDSTFETFDILIVKRGADYKLTTLSVGDATGISFDITAGGMITYSSGALISASLKYLVNTII